MKQIELLNFLTKPKCKITSEDWPSMCGMEFNIVSIDIHEELVLIEDTTVPILEAIENDYNVSKNNIPVMMFSFCEIEFIL